jgi:DNA-binding MurR/RpiR family transcriptional regulator
LGVWRCNVADGTRTPGYLTIAEARERLGVSKMTMLRLMKRFNVATYSDPRDARVKLIKVGDVERLMQPIPTPEAGKAKAA